MPGESDKSGNPGSSGPGTGTGVDPQAGGGNPKPGQVTFTAEQQEAINRIVSQRVNEVKAGYKQAEDDSRILQQLMKDENFLEFINGGGELPNKGAASQGNSIEALMAKDEISGKDVVALIQHLLGTELKPISRAVDELTNSTRQLGTDTSLQRMASQVDPKTGDALYPYLWDGEFRNEVLSMLGKRAANPIDAYHLAVRDREVNGKGVPETAYLLEGSGTTRRRGGREDESKPLTREDLKLDPKAGIRDIIGAVFDRVNGGKQT